MPKYEARPAYALFARVLIGPRKKSATLLYVYAERAQAEAHWHKLAKDGLDCWVEETTLKLRA